MSITINHENFYPVCDILCNQDIHLQSVILKHGYPPLWSRPNTFESLVHIILEQQVSLASALATLNKLKKKVGLITPESVMLLTDEELRACYFSQQKTRYVRHLAISILNGTVNLDELALMDDNQIRDKLTLVKGIGNWTVDIYLMFIVHHADVFPIGDLAAVNALKKVMLLPATTPREEVLGITDLWRPYRTVATMILWHNYLQERKK